MGSSKGYRGPLYIIKDIILTLSEYGELNQTSLISFCGLNLKTHRHFLDDLEKKHMITRIEQKQGKRNVIMYKTTHEGLEFCRNILQPFEDVFPRKAKIIGIRNPKLNLLILV